MQCEVFLEGSKWDAQNTDFNSFFGHPSTSLIHCLQSITIDWLLYNADVENKIIYLSLSITVDFGGVKTALTESKEKCSQMISPYLYHCKAPQNVLMLMIHLRKRSDR